MASDAVHNERVKLFATALNNVGVGSILAGIVGPAVNGHVGDFPHTIVWVILGAEFLTAAFLALGRFR